MEDNKDNNQTSEHPKPKFINAEKFLHTFTKQVNDPGWIEIRRQNGADTVVYTLGSGSSNVETDAINFLWPNAKKFAVDPDNTGKMAAEYFGFNFITKSATDPTIYQEGGQELNPDLVIIRNPKPTGDSEMWTEAIRLAWEKMKPGGILYVTASSNEREKNSEILSNALNKSEEEFIDSWKVNPQTLGLGAFPDQIVICLKK